MSRRGVKEKLKNQLQYQYNEQDAPHIIHKRTKGMAQLEEDPYKNVDLDEEYKQIEVVRKEFAFIGFHRL